MIAEIIWPIIVARAAPCIPICGTNIASNTTLRTAPDRLQNIAILGLPSALIIWPPPVINITNGKPMARILTYSTANGMIVSVAPNRVRIGSKNTSVTINNNVPTDTNPLKPLPI